MRRSSRQRRILTLSIAFAAIPFAFALIRAVRTGSDFRYFWLAIASLLAAVVVTTAGKRCSTTFEEAVPLSAIAFLVATLSAVLTASLLGGRVGPGSLLVASAFGFCFAVSSLLYARARTRRS